MKKRFLSCFMALTLCLTLLPTAAFAEGAEGAESANAVATLTVGGATYFYTDLPSALKAASSEGGTVTLQKDVENVSEMLVIEGSLHVTLDLNGKEITGSGSKSTLLGISNYSDVTICDSGTNGLIKCTASGYAVYVSAGCYLTIAGGTFEGTDNEQTGAPGYAAGVNDAKLIITGGTFNSPVDAKDKLIVSGGTFNGAVNISARGATITGGTFNGAFSMSAQPDVFSGGTFTQQAVFSNVSNILTGGTFENGIKSTDKMLYELLAENKAYQTADDWLDVDTTYFYNGIGSSVTVAEAPIHSVTLTVNGTSVELDEDNKGRFSVELGTAVTLTASCEGSMEAPYGTWYSVYGDEDGGTGPVVQRSTGKSLSYTLPAEDLTIGTHTYRVSFCSEDPGKVGQVTGYYKVAQITITVTKIDLANAEVTINPWPTDGKVRFSPFYLPAASVLTIFDNSVHNQITVKANGTEGTLSNDDYTYEGATATQVGKHKLTITATDSCAKYTGSKTIDWEVVPYALPAPVFLGNQTYTKTYDGTTTLPEKYTFQALFPDQGFERPEVDWRKDEYKDYYEVTAAEFVSADAGKNKPINQTITLKNENFVFEPTEIINVEGITTTGKTITYTNFTPTEAYPSAGTTFNIEKATMPDVNNAVTLTVINDLADTYTVDLNALLPALESPKTYGEIGYGRPAVWMDSGYYTPKNAKVENGKLILTINKNPVTTTGPIGTVTVKVSSTNYHDFDLTINVNAANKPVSSGGGSSSGSSTVKTEITKNNDGSITKTEIRKDGTVIETTTGKDGSVTKTTTKPDGSSVTEIKAADGSTGTVKTDKNGQTTAETALSSKAIENAKRNGEPVTAPVEVKATRDSSTAPTVKIELPENSGETKVEIPVSNVNSGTVAVLVHADGTEEILKDSIPTKDGIQLTVNGSATVKIVDNSKDFIDTQNHWAKDAICFVSARGLVNGMNDSTYAPNASTTRAQLWTILARQNGVDLSGGATWFEYAQNWAKEKGISDGANPNGTINRAQMITMLWRAMGQPAAAGSASFVDVPADSYYAQAVAWGIENDITTGVGGGKFDPTATCTRAQIAAFLARSMK